MQHISETLARAMPTPSAGFSTSDGETTTATQPLTSRTDMPSQNPKSNLPQKPSNAPALRENPQARDKIDALLLGCFSVQKLYGRDPGSLEAVTQVFHSALGRFPADKVFRAFNTWLERSHEFPTPADIVGLIKRCGKPPMTEAQFIAISKKEGEDRTEAEWQFLRDWNREQEEGWADDDQEREKRTIAENIRLRERIKFLEAENNRLIDMMRLPPPASAAVSKPTAEDKARATIAEMKAQGAPPEYIEEFALASGIAA